MGVVQSTTLNTDTNNKVTTGEYADRGDGTSKWFHWFRVADGGDAALGKTTDAAVTNPATAGTLSSVLRGILTFAANVAVGATSLLKTEDDAHASGDVGVMPLAVRKDTAAASSGTTGDYEPIQTDADGRVRATVTRDPDDALSVAAVSALAASLVVKASAGTLHGIIGYSTTAQYLQVHDASSLPADTAVPELSFPIPANTMFNIPLPGHVCATGITISNSTTGPTKTIGAADTWITGYYE